MTQEHAARFFKAVMHDESLQARLKATTEPEAFIQIASERGYKFTVAELDAQISKLSPEEFAAVINPGISPRRHITPR
ncbi:Nif11-like leader peptide family natural product precursor [Chroococcidiopsis sp. FACHB-1243]|uniref:Nif11-like leader peptide family natural product precursor n=1 Tax=Chroococcidiopsis sp. [FACHB-1243] TaxID=2692781 RepID=UPI0017813405|nr:Nif11-like leader peptide family natural product precursor [Chroococcidiopsis sp. [FACHB-1243]]MBD2308935.1 Nif11-like leader peptide family natural product precursor [Chroococcidiopsis sp. [FACHB-1243]]